MSAQAITLAATTLVSAIVAPTKVKAAGDQNQRLPAGDNSQKRGVAQDIENVDHAVEIRLDDRHHHHDQHKQERQKSRPRNRVADPRQRSFRGTRCESRGAHWAATGAASSLKKDASTLPSVLSSPWSSATILP